MGSFDMPMPTPIPDSLPPRAMVDIAQNGSRIKVIRFGLRMDITRATNIVTVPPMLVLTTEIASLPMVTVVLVTLMDHLTSAITAARYLLNNKVIPIMVVQMALMSSLMMISTMLDLRTSLNMSVMK